MKKNPTTAAKLSLQKEVIATLRTGNPAGLASPNPTTSTPICVLFAQEL